MNHKIEATMVRLCTMLAEQNYRELEQLSGGNRLSAEELSTVIAEYGRTVVPPPSEAVKLLNAVLVTGSVPKRWSVQMPLWTKEEGRSDLTLEATLVEEGDVYRVELDDLHVL